MPRCDDVRDAPSFDIAAALLKMGAHVKAFDPVGTEEFRRLHPDLELEYSENAYALAENCDAVVVVTEWTEFAELSLSELKKRMCGAVLVDGRNIFDPEKAADCDFQYFGIGRTAKPKLAQRKTIGIW